MHKIMESNCWAKVVYLYVRKIYVFFVIGHCKGVGPCPPADGVGEIQFFNNLDSVCPHCMVNSSTDSTGINRTRLTLHYLMSSSSHLIVNDRQKQNTRMDSYFFFNHIPTESVGNVWNFEKSPHYLDSADPSHIRAVMPSEFVPNFVYFLRRKRYHLAINRSCPLFWFLVYIIAYKMCY